MIKLLYTKHVFDVFMASSVSGEVSLVWYIWPTCNNLTFPTSPECNIHHFCVYFDSFTHYLIVFL